MSRRRRIRRYRRADPRVRGWFAGGFRPLLPLVLVTLYAVTTFAHSIEDAVRTRVRAVLDREGMGWASVEASGQNVLLRGMPPSPLEGQRARRLAESTTCPTWLGEGDCTVEVRAQLDDVPVAPATRASVGEEAAGCDRDLAALSSRAPIQFETGRATIRPESHPLLEKIAELARHCSGRRLSIEGHTDAIGSEEANLQLSRDRAAAVREQLVRRGLPPDELVTRGFGESRPVSSNDTEDGRARNRRIEFHSLLEGPRIREPKT